MFRSCSVVCELQYELSKAPSQRFGAGEPMLIYDYLIQQRFADKVKMDHTKKQNQQDLI